MAAKYYGVAPSGQLAKDVTIGDATTGALIELVVDTSVPKIRLLEAIEALENAVQMHYSQSGVG